MTSITNLQNNNINDSRFGTTKNKEGNFTEMIKNMFKLHCKLNGLNVEKVRLDQSLLKVPKAQITFF